MNTNSVVLIGNLTKDVDCKYIKHGGSKIAKFTIAVNGYSKEVVSYFNVVCFDKLAELCEKYLSKGKKICVMGSLNQNRWVDKNGQNRSTIDIFANRIEFLSPQPKQNATGKFDDVIYDGSDFDSTPLDSRSMNDDVSF